MGVFGGLGGGGGPRLLAFDVARCLAGSTGAPVLANFPASVIGGGALNLRAGRGGEGVRAGDSGGELGWLEDKAIFWLSGRLLRLGGGAGGGPLFDEIVLPVC